MSGAQDDDAGRGLFITFEGGEGVGKSTQQSLLAERLRGLGHDVVVSREPGGTAGAEAVRHVLLEAQTAKPFGPVCEAMLFAAARNDHVEQVIRPAVERGSIVLVDRFMDSTRVYQGMSGDLEPGFVSALERVAVAGMVPDATVLLDLDAELGLSRAAARRGSGSADRFEGETVAIHEARRQAFLKLADDEPDRFILINAEQPEEAVAASIWKELDAKFALSEGAVPVHDAHSVSQ